MRFFVDFAKEFPKTAVYLSGTTISGVCMTGSSLYEETSRNDKPGNFAYKVSKHILIFPVSLICSLQWPAVAGKYLFDKINGIEHK
jgi:hypothetical protein